jgi:pyridoxine 4-dehydrogenase
MARMTTHASQSGTFLLGGDLPVHRLGFGAMRITGKGVWGPPKDREESLRVLRRAVALGVTLIDTAESYGPQVSEQLIADALYPYPDDLVIATKGGLDRPGPDQWVPNGRPERLREELDGSLKRLRLERIDLWQLHRIDPNVPAGEQFDAIAELQRSGKIRHVGLSEVKVDDIEKARKYSPVASVQNRYNLTDREWEPVLDYCQKQNIGFIPWYPLAVGKLAQSGGALAKLAARHHAEPSQIALAWLLRRSPVMLPIPGTSQVSHLEENMAAVNIELSDDDMEQMTKVT